MAKRLHLTIHGRVQGVSFRAYTQREARALGLTGWVRNRVDGTVECMAEGPREALERLALWCRGGSPWARVERIEDQWSDASGEHADFVVSPTH